MITPPLFWFRDRLAGLGGAWRSSVGSLWAGIFPGISIYSSASVVLDEAASAFARLPSSDPGACIFFPVGGLWFALASLA